MEKMVFLEANVSNWFWLAFMNLDLNIFLLNITNKKSILNNWYTILES